MAKVVNIGGKKDVMRKAVARGEIELKPATVLAVKAGKLPKGNVFATAEVATLHAIKKTWEVLPHCHQIPLTYMRVRLEAGRDSVSATVEVEATYKTGVEMEALYGVTVALLTVWDMVKSLEKDTKGQYPDTRITDVRVISKVKRRG